MDDLHDIDLIDKLLDEVSFERDFYAIIAGSDEYEVVSIDATKNSPLLATEDFQRKALEAQCDRTSLEIVYQVSYGDYAVVLCKNGGDLIGIVPEKYAEGWPC